MTTKTKRARGNPGKYPWGKWMRAGSRHTIKPGTDFQCSVHSFITYLYTMAAKLGRRVSVNQLTNGNIAISVEDR